MPKPSNGPSDSRERRGAQSGREVADQYSAVDSIGNPALRSSASFAVKSSNGLVLDGPRERDCLIVLSDPDESHGLTLTWSEAAFLTGWIDEVRARHVRLDAKKCVESNQP